MKKPNFKIALLFGVVLSMIGTEMVRFNSTPTFLEYLSVLAAFFILFFSIALLASWLLNW